MTLAEIDFRQTFFVLDFDRCLGDTDKAHDVLWHVIEQETGMTGEVLEATKTAVEQKGQTFHTLEYVIEELARHGKDGMWPDIRRAYVAAAQKVGILTPHANDLLDTLDERSIPYGVLTYGEQSWQLTKLEAAGLVVRGVPFEITQIEHKGRVLSGWKQGDVLVVPPAMTRDFQPLRVRHIVFLDDKPRSFHELPADVYGICVRPPYALRANQQGALPDGVQEVEGIGGALRLLFGNR